MNDDPRITPNCRQQRCRACTGCDHTCHHRPMPQDFRDLVASSRGHHLVGDEPEEATR